jgi:hypothetical protein
VSGGEDPRCSGTRASWLWEGGGWERGRRRGRLEVEEAEGESSGLFSRGRGGAVAG